MSVLPFTVSFVPSDNEPPPITAVERSVAPDDNEPVVVEPVVVVLPFTVRFAFVAGVPTVVAPDCNVPVVVFASVAVPPL